MAVVYISSTFKDLAEHRKQVYRAVQRMQHQVSSMEDYVAGDERPLARCLADVEKCDVYVGIFAWRYGHIPAEDNPEQKSITELELRHAMEKGKPCLLFMIEESAPWPPTKMDDGEAEQRILSLRRELTEKKLVSFFNSAEDLAGLVSASLHNWHIKSLGGPQQSAPPASVEPQQHREVVHHALLVCLTPDYAFAQKLARQLEPYGRSLLLDPFALYAGLPDDFQKLESRVRQCHTAIVLLSDAALVQMQQDAGRSRRILGMLRARTGHLIFLCPTGSSLAGAAAWGPAQLIDASPWGGGLPDSVQIIEVDRALAGGTRQGLTDAAGLPFLVVAMKEDEARQLAPELLTQRLGEATGQRFRTLTESLTAGGAAPWLGRYGPQREDWRPFPGSAQTVVSLIGEVVDRLNQLDRGRAIKIQHYPFDPLVEKDPLLRGVYREISKTGCVVLIDELSLFHPEVRDALFASPLVSSELATLVTIAPFDPYGVPLNEILETELRQRLAVAFDRYMYNFDPLCELGVGSEQRLRRWFHGSLPEALRNLRDPGPDKSRIAAFESSHSKDSVGATKLVFSPPRPGKTF